MIFIIRPAHAKPLTPSSSPSALFLQKGHDPKRIPIRDANFKTKQRIRGEGLVGLICDLQKK